MATHLQKRVVTTTITLVILSTVASFLSLRFLTVPYLWISLFWFAAFLYATISSRKPLLKILSYSAGTLVLVLGGAEAYLWAAQDDRDDRRWVVIEGTDEKDVRSDFLGYASGRDIKVSESRYEDDDLVYNVIYTMNSDGLRISAIVDGAVNPQCVLFFGGSFAYGIGVNDTQTMPYLVGLKSDGKYRVHNFAIGGYGPHQMLSALEHGSVEDTLDCQPKYAVYLGITDHVRRVAGLASWDRHGPRYELGENEKVSFQGNFDDHADDRGTLQPFVNKINRQLNKSFLYANTLGKTRSVGPADVLLAVNIVKAARDFIETRFPGSEFHVLFWDLKENYVSSQMINGLKQKAINLHLMSDILPRYAEDRSIYKISPHDGHPNPLAHEIIADYVLYEILGIESIGEQSLTFPSAEYSLR